MALTRNLQKPQINHNETDNNHDRNVDGYIGLDSTTLLFEAVKNMDLEWVKILLEEGAEINAKVGYGYSPLHVAIVLRLGNIELVQVLLNNGADVNSTTRSGGTPILDAVRANNLELTRILLSAGADVNIAEGGVTPLLKAALRPKKNYEIIEILVEHGADMNVKDNLRETLLYAMVEVNNTKMVKLLLNKGAKVNKPVISFTPLHKAVQNGNLEITDTLLKYGADVNAKSIISSSGFATTNSLINGHTPWNEAHERKNKEIMKLLLKYDAAFDSRSGEGCDSFMDAIEENDVELVNVILNKLVGFNAKIPGRDYNPLYEAIKTNSIACVELLLDSFADIHETNSFGQNIFDIVFDTEFRKRLETYLTQLMCGEVYALGKYYGRTDNIYRFQKECRKEIKMLKRENIAGYGTLYNILLAGINFLLPNLIDFELPMCKFRIYGGMLNMEFETMKRKQLLNYDIAFFDCFVDKLPLLPYLCRKHILSFLSIQDLRNVMKVIEGEVGEVLGEQRNACKLE